MFIMKKQFCIKIVTILICFIGVIPSTNAEPCGDNEVHIKNKTLPTCQKSCSNPNAECNKHHLGWEGCACQPGYIRNRFGKCILTSMCEYEDTICSAKEIQANMAECHECDRTCRIRADTCERICPTGCYCRPAYVRNSKSICVLPSECDMDDMSNKKEKEEEETTKATTAQSLVTTTATTALPHMNMRFSFEVLTRKPSG